MSFNHGVRTQEISSGIITMRNANAGLPFVVGTALKGPINVPTYCESFEEFSTLFGYDDDWTKYTLNEFAYSQFMIYGVRPAIFVNVRDPNKKITVEEEEVEAPITANDIIGVDSSGNISGLQLIKQVYTRFSLVPSLILCPSWSQNPAVSAAMTAAAKNIDGLFEAIAITDIDTSAVENYQQVNTWKTNNSYTDERQIVCWPKIKLGEKIYNMSTALAGVIGVLDNENGDVPYQSPSNQAIKATGLCRSNGEEIILTHSQGTLLNSQGVTTVINRDGLNAWGNYMGSYPRENDPLDFIPVRRMFNFIRNSFVLNYFSQIDQPLNRRTLKHLVDNLQSWLNGYVTAGNLVSGRVEYSEEENPAEALASGKLTLHLYITPPSPLQELVGLLEYDLSGYDNFTL